jgi:hypothetical protein
MSSFTNGFGVLPTIGTPGDIIARADSEIARANTFILKLGELTTGLTPPVITPVFPDGGSAPALTVPALPTFSGATWVSPAAPSAFTETLTVTDLIPAAFSETAPVLAYGTAPAAFSETAPDSPAITTTFTDPTLNLTLPAAPDLLSISVTPFGGLNLPTFSADEPVLSVVAPSVREYVPGTQYTSALLTQLQTTLLERLTNGGTGLSAEAENALWDRARERDYRSQAAQILELERMETLGYTFPSGVFLDARLRIMTESAATMAGTSREIMVKQAELEQSNVQSALQAAQQLEGTLINYSNSVEQRLFDATKYATEAGVAIYNAQVQAYQSLVDVYRTKVQIYEAQVRAEIANVDAYRAQIEAERAKADVNTALVNQYRVKADVALSAIEIYKAEISAIQTKAEIEKLKVEVFGEQIKAYGAKVNAYTAGVEGYRASLEAESTGDRRRQAGRHPHRRVQGTDRRQEHRAGRLQGGHRR